MANKKRQIGIGFALIIVAVFGLLISRIGSQPAASAGSAPIVKAVQPAAPSGGVSVAAAAPASQDGQQSPAVQTYPNGVRVVSEIKHDTSPPLRDIPPAPVQIKKEENENNQPVPRC